MTLKQVIATLDAAQKPLALWAATNEDNVDPHLRENQQEAYRVMARLRKARAFLVQLDTLLGGRGLRS